MRPVVVTAILLVVLMSMSASVWNPGEMCRKTKFQTRCRPSNFKEWHKMGNRCVKAFYHTAHLTFKDAEKACRRFPNGHLVSLHNGEELHQVECAMWKEIKGKAHYWIGVKLVAGHRYRGWMWTDGSGGIDNYRRWAWGQPESYRNEYCVEINYHDWGFWNNKLCSSKRAYVCSLKL